MKEPQDQYGWALLEKRKGKSLRDAMRETPTADASETRRGESQNRERRGKPEAPQHSQLPWRTLENYKGGIPLSIQSDENTTVARVDWLPNGNGRASDKCKANAKLIVTSVNNAGKLAEALRDYLRDPRSLEARHYAKAMLADYEASKQ